MARMKAAVFVEPGRVVLEGFRRLEAHTHGLGAVVRGNDSP